MGQRPGYTNIKCVNCEHRTQRFPNEDVGFGTCPKCGGKMVRSTTLDRRIAKQKEYIERDT